MAFEISHHTQPLCQVSSKSVDHNFWPLEHFLRQWHLNNSLLATIHIRYYSNFFVPLQQIPALSSSNEQGVADDDLINIIMTMLSAATTVKRVMCQQSHKFSGSKANFKIKFTDLPVFVAPAEISEKAL